MVKKDLKYKRVMLKLSGEVFKGDGDSGIDFKVLDGFVKQVKSLMTIRNLRLGIVVGGGNIWRYRDNKNDSMGRVALDSMGMLATCMNAVAIEDALNRAGVRAKAVSAFPCSRAVDDYVPKDAKKLFDDSVVVIFAGGTGNPYFTTDSAAAIRALEMECDAVLKATKVDYVYDKDPEKFPDAKKFKKISYKDVIDMELGVMDLTCASLLDGKDLPMVVFKFDYNDGISNVLFGFPVGTYIY